MNTMTMTVMMMRWSCHKKPSLGGGARWHSDLGDNTLLCWQIRQIHLHFRCSTNTPNTFLLTNVLFCELLFQWILWRLFLKPAPFDDLLNLACVLPVMLSKHLNISGILRLKSFWRDDSQIVHLVDSQTILPSSWVRSLVTQSHASRLL